MSGTEKTGKTVTTQMNTKMLCPKCGHDDFKVANTRFSWLTGEKFKCSKCGKTFKNAKLVRVKTITKEYEKKQRGSVKNQNRTKRKKHR